jgi:hypothetical protein
MSVVTAGVETRTLSRPAPCPDPDFNFNMSLCTSHYYTGLDALYGASVLCTLPVSVHCAVRNAFKGKSRSKVHPGTGHEDPDRMVDTRV